MLYHLPQTGFWNKSQTSYNFTRFLQTVNLSQNLLVVESQFSFCLLGFSSSLLTWLLYSRKNKQTKNQPNYYSSWFSVYPPQSHIQSTSWLLCVQKRHSWAINVYNGKQSVIQIPNPVLVEVYLLKPLLMENNFMAKLNNS